jgi:hypothetical protein
MTAHPEGGKKRQHHFKENDTLGDRHEDTSKSQRKNMSEPSAAIWPSRSRLNSLFSSIDVSLTQNIVVFALRSIE